jgi:hypothetical protein
MAVAVMSPPDHQVNVVLRRTLQDFPEASAPLVELQRRPIQRGLEQLTATLQDGTVLRLALKYSPPSPNSPALRELLAYRYLLDPARTRSPRLLGTVLPDEPESGGRTWLLMEWLLAPTTGREMAEIQGMFRALGELHAHTRTLPEQLAESDWPRPFLDLLTDPPGLAGDPSAMQSIWMALVEHITALARDAAWPAIGTGEVELAERAAIRADGLSLALAMMPQGLLHGDLRAHNIGWRGAIGNGGAVLLDWTQATVGPTYFDLRHVPLPDEPPRSEMVPAHLAPLALVSYREGLAVAEPPPSADELLGAHRLIRAYSGATEAARLARHLRTAQLRPSERAHMLGSMRANLEDAAKIN